MRDLYEVGIIFRGFVIVCNEYKELPTQKEPKIQRDLRAAFISAISSFAETAFSNNSLEYLESGSFLFIFKMSEIKPNDNVKKEPIIMYGLTEKKKKNPDKFVQKFLNKLNPIIESFIYRYTNKDFTELSQFKSFQDDLKRYFIKEKSE